MVSLSAAQSKVSDTLHSAVAGNPTASAIRVEAEVVYMEDPLTGTQVVSETTHVIVETVSSGDCFFVMPPAPGPDQDGDGGSSFSYDELVSALTGADVQVRGGEQAVTLEDAFFGQAGLQGLQHELADATAVFVNSADQLEEVLTALPALADDRQPLVVVAPGVPILESMPGVVMSLADFAEQRQLENPASMPLAAAELPTSNRESLMRYLEDTGELDALEAQVDALGEQVAAQDSIFAELVAPSFHDAGIAYEVRDGLAYALPAEVELEILSGTSTAWQENIAQQAVGMEEQTAVVDRMADSATNLERGIEIPEGMNPELKAEYATLEAKLERLVHGLENDQVLSQRSTIHSATQLDSAQRANMREATAFAENELTLAFAQGVEEQQLAGSEALHEPTITMPSLSSGSELGADTTIDLRQYYATANETVAALREELGLEPIATSDVAQDATEARATKPKKRAEPENVESALSVIRAVVREALSENLASEQSVAARQKQAA